MKPIALLVVAALALAACDDDLGISGETRWEHAERLRQANLAAAAAANAAARASPTPAAPPAAMTSGSSTGMDSVTPPGTPKVTLGTDGSDVAPPPPPPSAMPTHHP